MTNRPDLIHRYRYSIPYIVAVLYGAYVVAVFQMTWHFR